MSIQVHVPLIKVGTFTDNCTADKDSVVKMEKLRKVDNSGRSLHQSANQAVDIEFEDLTYSVSEGRQKGTYLIKHVYVLL